MAISILTHHGRNVVFGTTWVPLVGNRAEKDELRAIAKKHSASRGVRVANEYSTLFGVLPREELGSEEQAQLKRGNAYSVAALLAGTPHITRDAIWIEVEGEGARMAALVDSLPVVGSEFVGSRDDAFQLIDQIKADNPQHHFTYYGNCHDLFPSSIDLALADLTDGNQDVGALLDKVQQSSSVKQIALLAILIGLASYLIVPWFIHKPAPVQPTTVKEDPNVTYWRVVPQKLHDEALPVSAVRDVITGNWQDDVLQGGWIEQSINCTFASCSYSWSIAGGDNASFTAAMGKRAYTFAGDGKTITYPVANGPIGSTRLDARTLPTYEQFALSVGSLVQKLSLLQATSSLSMPTMFGAELVPGVNAADIKNIVRVGQLTINGRAALLKPLLAELPDCVSIDSLNILIGAGNSSTVKPDPTFILTAKYYVKN